MSIDKHIPKYYLKGFKQAQNNAGDNEHNGNSKFVFGMLKSTWEQLRKENNKPVFNGESLRLHYAHDKDQLAGYTIPVWGLTLKLDKENKEEKSSIGVKEFEV